MHFQYKCYLGIYVQDPTLIITVPADVLAPIGARTSAGTVIPEKNKYHFYGYQWLCMACVGYMVPFKMANNICQYLIGYDNNIFPRINELWVYYCTLL